MRLLRCAAFPLVPLTLVLAACGAPDADTAGEGTEAAAADGSASVVEVTARDFAFDAPSEIPAGWTTFRFENQGAQEHFMVLWKMPEGRTIEDYRAEVLPAFDNARYLAGEIDREEFVAGVVGAIPEWYGGVESAGGVGLLSPGHVAHTTVSLAPGSYVMECYVKTPDGKFHSALGMLHPLTVGADATDTPVPEHDLDISLTNYEIGVEGELSAGPHTARVRHVDNPEGFLKHDLHLARFDGEAGIEDLVPWMEWIDGMESPAPVEFIGGSEDQPAGGSAYFAFTLEPGSYAWISESYAAQGMVLAFEVE